MKPYRCVKCAGAHKTSECTKKDRNTPAMCALCLGPHPANYKGCEVYQEILSRKTQKKFPIKQRKEEHQKQNERDITDPINLNSVDARPPPKQNTKKEHKTYAEAINNQKSIDQTFTQPGSDTQSAPYKTLEHMFIKQSEKIDLLLQQMSTLLQLITTLISKGLK